MGLRPPGHLPGCRTPRAAALRRYACALTLAVCSSGSAAPSTFGPVIGSALLCRSHLDNAYFQSYLNTAFGPSYKHEGGAYWYKADGNLWGAQVTDIILSDDTSELVFLGAVTEATPDKLEEAIRGSAGVRHKVTDASTYPVRESLPGSRIVYFKTKSKIYCAKYKPLPILR
ncbi:hypothetical protein [Massilia sp. CF038]|uniref:hypothetical protein n=1 Tax=Massilia sp. CF038 TaxID=1881045 RepID=UPI0009183078|nr:hypothetical protein [Massilia sp. CF038]SHH16684.1 hypothetical protein SAMN05428948_3118 [Massilia sp. CF038]